VVFEVVGPGLFEPSEGGDGSFADGAGLEEVEHPGPVVGGDEGDLGVEEEEKGEAEKEKGEDEGQVLFLVVEDEEECGKGEEVEGGPVGEGRKGEGEAEQGERFFCGEFLEMEEGLGGEEQEEEELGVEEFGLGAVINGDREGVEDGGGVEGGVWVVWI
jgi:hypothetical protein